MDLKSTLTYYLRIVVQHEPSIPYKNTAIIAYPFTKPPRLFSFDSLQNRLG